MKVIDNILPATVFERIQNTILNEGFPWYWGRSAGEHALNGNLFLYGWSHIILGPDGYQSPMFAPMELGILTALDLADEPAEEVYRLRLIQNTVADSPYLNGAHIDYNNWSHPGRNRTALLYLNDADGPTVIYNEIYEPRFGNMDQHYKKIKDNLTVMETVEPKANRLVVFDGRHYHTGTLPTSTARRVVLNINYIRV